MYHGCISGQYLDDRVNQERTNFSFKNNILDNILRDVAGNIIESVLAPENKEYEKKRLDELKKFCKTHPSYHFDSYDNLLKKNLKLQKIQKTLLKHWLFISLGEKKIKT
ncbi:hypothetical protein [Bartonella machadoae]|uniref:hypothetical protein n=1 Tax=Bartonella machadoae TaxID=2893471 RepID=UPI001F4C78DD|nr:hypothetical protein [Bartonella machadoae]UNE53465.1 hypothetical protein LNM86_07215 [Bartonella machadoae]